MNVKEFLKPTTWKIIVTLVLTIAFAAYRYLSIKKLCQLVDCFHTGELYTIFDCCNVGMAGFINSYFLNIILPFIVIYVGYSLISRR